MHLHIARRHFSSLETFRYKKKQQKMEPSRHYNLIIICVIKLFFEGINKLVGVHCDELHGSSFPVVILLILRNNGSL